MFSCPQKPGMLQICVSKGLKCRRLQPEGWKINYLRDKKEKKKKATPPQI